jgi:hypothetical protein
VALHFILQNQKLEAYIYNSLGVLLSTKWENLHRYFFAGEETEQCRKTKEKWGNLVAARPSYLADRPGIVASRPWPIFPWVLTPLESTWWCSVMLLWSVSCGNNFKHLKFWIFEVFSCYPWLHFILSMIPMCYSIILCLMWLIWMKTMLAYIALEFGPQLCNFVSWANILGNVLPRCWRCDITLFTLPLNHVAC